MKYLRILVLSASLSTTLSACNPTPSTPGPSTSPSPGASASASPGTSPSPAGPVAAAACPSSATIDTSKWQTVTEAGFNFKLPPAYRKAEIQGIDSLVGRWAENDKRYISYDYGGFSSTLDEGKDLLSGYSECTIETGTLKARVVAGKDSTGRWDTGGTKYVVAGAWRNITPGLHLSFTTTDATESGLPTLYAILRTVRFTP